MEGIIVLAGLCCRRLGCAFAIVTMTSSRVPSSKVAAEGERGTCEERKAEPIKQMADQFYKQVVEQEKLKVSQTVDECAEMFEESRKRKAQENIGKAREKLAKAKLDREKKRTVQFDPSSAALVPLTDS